MGKFPTAPYQSMTFEYLERSLHRIMCAWGNQFLDWDDKQALSRHVWEQAEIVRRLRNRIEQFPGLKAGAPVSKELEILANTVLMATDFEDAVNGIYQILSNALVLAYDHFSQSVHPIHDAPTHEIIQEIVSIKELQRTWLRDYRRRNPHQTNQAYQQTIADCLVNTKQLQSPLPLKGQAAEQVGLNTTFKMKEPRIDPSWVIRPDKEVMPHLIADFANNIETRRLFWAIGYMRELNLAIAQLKWMYDAPYMPWAFHHDESRHMWDESRHGDSGYSRLKDFGLKIQDIGFTNASKTYPALGDPTNPLTPKELYEAVFFIGMVAETGHFKVKREAYADFQAGGDMESAEMMLFDMIDETAHVQYVKRWLGPIAKHDSTIDHANYEQRASEVRSQKQVEKNLTAQETRQLPRQTGDPPWDQYQHFLQVMRQICPLSNAQSCPPRLPLPM